MFNLLIIKLIENHFKMNPVIGGMPLVDNRRSGTKILIKGCILVKEDDEIWKMLVKYINRNKGEIIREYIIKYNIEYKGLNSDNASIHPRCVIDEYAKIVRSFVWFIPIKPPTIALIDANKISKLVIDLDIIMVT